MEASSKLVGVVQLEFLSNIEDPERQSADREKVGQANAEHQCDEDTVHDGGVFEVHLVNWSFPDVNVLLDHVSSSIVLIELLIFRSTPAKYMCVLIARPPSQ